MADLVVIDRPAEHVTRLTLNRPDALNAVDAELCEALHRALRTVAADRQCRVVVLTGAGRAFCVGLDINGYGTPPGNDGSDPARDHLGVQQHLSSVVRALHALPQPVIVAINGPAAGIGLALALAGDVRYATRDAVLRVAFVNIGVSNCDMGTSWLLPRLVGAARAHELMLTGRRFDAEEADRIGLVARVLDGAEALGEQVLDTAGAIAALAPWAVRLTKQGMWAALAIPSLDTAIEYEDRQQALAVHSGAHAEAVQAFLEKRTPSFPD